MAINILSRKGIGSPLERYDKRPLLLDDFFDSMFSPLNLEYAISYNSLLPMAEARAITKLLEIELMVA